MPPPVGFSIGPIQSQNSGGRESRAAVKSARPSLVRRRFTITKELNMSELKKGVIYKGMFFPLWGGLYCDMSNNPSFARAGLPGISRTIKAEMHDAAVVVEYETEERSDL